MKRLVVLMSVASILLLSSTAFAAGIGFFIDGSIGSGEAEWDSDFDSWDIDSSTVAGGFALDTAPTNEKTFNYRLNVGIGKQVIEDEDDIDLDSTGIYVENIFGFAMIKREDFRWWAGPLVRVGYYSGETDTFRSGSITMDIDIDYAEVGIGAVTGLNFSIGKAVICPSVGFRVSGFAGEGEIKVRDGFGTFTDEEDIDGNMTTAFGNLTLLF